MQKTKKKRENISLFEQRTLSMLYASFAVSLTYLVLFFAQINALGWMKFFYLSASAFLILLFVSAIEILKEQKDTLFSRTVLDIYPYLFVTIGAITFHLVESFMDERIVFLLILLTITIITLKPFRNSLFIYLYAYTIFNFSYYLKYGFPSQFFFTTIAVIIMFNVLNVLFNKVVIRLYQTTTELKKMNAAFHSSLTQLVETNYQLEHTKKISDMMMNLMTEIIHNDDIDSLLNKVIEQAVLVMPNAQAGTILVKQDHLMIYKAAFGYNLEVLRQIQLTVEDTFEHKLGNHRKAAIIQNSHSFNLLHASKRFTQQMMEHQIPSSKSVITCPILFNDVYYGSINLDHLEKENAFSEADISIVSYLASQIGLILSNHQLLEKTLYSTKHDTLTGAYSRIHHNEKLEEIYKQANRNQKTFCIVLIDLNDLKKTNDTLGHQTGDLLLKYFVTNLNHFLDTLDQVSRTGGDEFTLLMNHKSYYEALKRVNHMKQWFDEHPLVVNRQKLKVCFGAGVACFPDDGKTLNALNEVADKRMYQDKKASKS
jgi:diguanylate cyclase (GGDEF)-like protein